MSETLIRYENVSICQQGLEILEEVNLELKKGEFVYFIGKVGSGKTSLLKTIYGELEIQSGNAEVMGQNMRTIKQKYIPELRRRLGIVFQDFQLLTDRTVYANLDFVLRATGWKNKVDINTRIEEVLELVGEDKCCSRAQETHTLVGQQYCAWSYQYSNVEIEGYLSNQADYSADTDSS